jgi:hypothetical protein
MLCGSIPGNLRAQGPRSGREEPAATAADFLVRNLEETRPGTRSLRRSSPFLGAVKGQTGVQLAFVLDGTESMGTELEALKREIGAIVENLKGQVDGAPFTVAVAVVVYRDSKAPSGPVSLVVSKFTEDVAEISQKLDEVRLETGAPYFDELADAGIHAALTQLPWSDNSDVSRWLLLCGDAPPYPEGAESRKFPLADLIKTATEKRVRVYGLSVKSGSDLPIAEEIKTTSDALRPECAAFMARLAEATGGKARNLWDRDAVLAELRQKPITVAMETISDEEIAKARKGLHVAASIAVLPPAVDGKPQFAAASEAALAATVSQRTLASLGLAVRGPASLEVAYQAAAKSAPGPDEAALRLAEQLGVDYVLSGALKTEANPSVTKITLALIRRGSKDPVATRTFSWSEKNSSSAPEQVADAVQKLLADAAKPGTPDAEKLSVSAKKPLPLKDDVLARDTRARRAILSALYALEKSLAAGTPVSAGDPSADQATAGSLLKTAQAELESATAYEADNPVVELLLSQVFYNLSQLGGTGDEAHQQHLHLQRAYDLRSRPEFEKSSWKNEIEACHALLIEKDASKAVAAFNALANETGRETSLSSLRARWMLAGIYFGDWGTRVFAPKLVDPQKAREQVLAILVRWPQLPEADYYRRCLQAARGSETRIPLVAIGAKSVH